jgi:hypothetical protein
MNRKYEFNNGFITAITLFLEHKDGWQLIRMKDNKVISDMRLYGATDHLYDLEIPKIISEKLKKTILSWRSECFKYRLLHFTDTSITDRLFREAEDIIAKIDMEVFHTKKIVINYR